MVALVAECAGVADRINQLVGLRDRAQNAMNHLRETPRPPETDGQQKQVEWVQRIRQFVEPIAATDPEIRGFLETLLIIPETPPTDPHRLKDLCAEVENARVTQIEELTQKIAAWNQEISTLYRPFQPTEILIRSFIGELRDTLCRIPVGLRELREVRSEIERLPIWDTARKRTRLGMKGSMVDLVSLRGRLDELLGYLPNTAGHVVAPQPPGTATSVVSSDGTAVEFLRKRRRGPKPAMERHHKITEIVKCFGNDWRKEHTLEQIAEDLDRAKVSVPKAWKQWERVPQTWVRAVEYHADRVRKILTHSLEMMTRHNSSQTPGTPAVQS